MFTLKDEKCLINQRKTEQSVEFRSLVSSSLLLLKVLQVPDDSNLLSSKTNKLSLMFLMMHNSPIPSPAGVELSILSTRSN